MFEWKTASNPDRVSYLGLQLQAQRNNLTQLQTYYDGMQPAAFLAPELAAQLQYRISSVNVNYCKTLTDNLTQRITLTGFAGNAAASVLDGLWRAWKSNRMNTEADLLLRDVLGLGRGYVLAWADSKGRPTITVESPFHVITYGDPITGEVLGALKQWSAFDDVIGQSYAYSVLYLPDDIVSFRSVSPAVVNSIPATGWAQIDSTPNPLGVVPMVPFINRANSLDALGTSEYLPIMGLQDGLNKILLDALTASEYGAFARRWVTGLSLNEDDDGNPISPFGMAWDEIWQTDNENANFGQFTSQSLEGFDTLSNLFTRHISAVSGLPEYLTGTGLANPESADAIRASEQGLSAKAQAKCDLLAPAFGQVAALVVAIQTRRPVNNLSLEPVYADLDRKSDAMATDAFAKLVAAGVPASIAAKRVLGWTDEEAAELDKYNPEKRNDNDRAV